MKIKETTQTSKCLPSHHPNSVENLFSVLSIYVDYSLNNHGVILKPNENLRGKLEPQIWVSNTYYAFKLANYVINGVKSETFRIIVVGPFWVAKEYASMRAY